MPRRSLNPTPLTKWRLNEGIATGMLVDKTGLPQISIYRIERGNAMSRLIVSKYLGYWGADLNSLDRMPVKISVIDEGSAVRISLSS